MDRKTLLETLLTTLRDIGAQGSAYNQAVAGRLGINGTDLECLTLITGRGAVTAGGLSEATGLTSGAITGVIDRLERAGYAVRQADPGDRRKVLVRAAPAAPARVQPLFAPMDRAAAAALAAYSEAQLQLLLDLLERVQQAGRIASEELRDPLAAARQARS
jgi:DNA-binding MarR family transcriptional regulator